DLKSGTELRALHGHSRSPSRIRFSPDGTTVVAGHESSTVKRWNAASGNEASPLPGHTGVVRCVAFSPDGRWLASGGEDRTVLLHPLAEGRLQMFQTPSAVHDVAFSPDGRTLAAVGAAQVPLGVRDPAPEATVHLWDLEAGKEKTWKG